MTTPALEYYSRSGEGELALWRRLPFSLFLKGEGGRLVVTVDGREGDLLVRHWRPDECRQDRPLPPFDEFLLPPGTPLKNEHTVLPGYNLLPYHIPERFRKRSLLWSTSWTQQLGYARDVDRYLNCDTHRECRRQWLLNAFFDANPLPLDNRTFRNRWRMWRRHLLIDRWTQGTQPVAAEVVFMDVYGSRPLLDYV